MNVREISALEHRPAEAETVDQFRARWSPRAMSGDAVTVADIHRLIEASRWAPSCFNAQPWRFCLALKGSDAWDALFGTLAEANQVWAVNAGALIAIVSRKKYEHNDKEAPTHSFDAGAAWMSLALQADRMQLAAHGMQGFDQAAARSALRLPLVYDLPAIIAIGHPGEVESLPEAYQSREVPSPRKTIDEILFEGNFEELI